MTVINLPSRFSERFANARPSERSIKNVRALVRILLFPGKLWGALGLVKDLTMGRFVIKTHLNKFKSTFPSLDEFSRMDGLAEIVSIREAVEPMFKSVENTDKNNSHYPLIKTISSIVKSIYNEISAVEKTYHKKIYTGSADYTSPAFKAALKKTYEGFELED